MWSKIRQCHPRQDATTALTSPEIQPVSVFANHPNPLASAPSSARFYAQPSVFILQPQQQPLVPQSGGQQSHDDVAIETTFSSEPNARAVVLASSSIDLRATNLGQRSGIDTASTKALRRMSWPQRCTGFSRSSLEDFHPSSISSGSLIRWPLLEIVDHDFLLASFSPDSETEDEQLCKDLSHGIGSHPPQSVISERSPLSRFLAAPRPRPRQPDSSISQSEAHRKAQTSWQWKSSPVRTPVFTSTASIPLAHVEYGVLVGSFTHLDHAQERPAGNVFDNPGLGHCES
jgi:hypothetical protein